MIRQLISFRIDGKDLLSIKKICQLRGENQSDFIRRSVKKELARLSYLSDEEKKALGFFQINNTREEI